MKAYGRRSTNSMTYKIKYLPLAVQDLNDVARYLSGFYPKTACRVLKEMRERITKLIENAKQNFAQENKTNGKPYQLSAPMGYAVSNLSAETIGDFMNRIDRQMYQDKLAYYEENAGRKR